LHCLLRLWREAAGIITANVASTTAAWMPIAATAIIITGSKIITIPDTGRVLDIPTTREAVLVAIQ
jgi:hypothetical protein